ncbi:hypothetical protein BC332_19089 [Capsicum chinense]|nr:hypothetical protein BC332_19089 [Capsicum chinense]
MKELLNIRICIPKARPTMKVIEKIIVPSFPDVPKAVWQKAVRETISEDECLRAISKLKMVLLFRFCVPKWRNLYEFQEELGDLMVASFGGSNIDLSAWKDKKNPSESCVPAQELKVRPCPIVFASFSGGPKSCAYKGEFRLIRDCLLSYIFYSSPVDFTSDLGTRFIIHPIVPGMSHPPPLDSWIANGIASSLDALFLRRFESHRVEFW